MSRAGDIVSPAFSFALSPRQPRCLHHTAPDLMPVGGGIDEILTKEAIMPIQDILRAKLAEAEERVRQLESDNRKLRHMLLAHEQELGTLECGHYVVTSDGWSGPYHSRAQAIEQGRDFAKEGRALSVEIVACNEAQEQSDDNAGIYRPWTMVPPARVAA